MSMNFKSKAVAMAAATLVGLAGAQAALASDHEDDASEPAGKLKPGCYTVKSGALTESSVNPKAVIGAYRLQLSSEQHGKSFVLKGPLAGAETGGEEQGDGARGSAAAAEEEGPHGGHNFGTDKAVGTFSSEGDSIEVTSVSCAGSDGVPRIIKGIETFKFVRGTGIFSNLSGGEIRLDLTYDACNNKNNPVTALTVISGQMCFR